LDYEPLGGSDMTFVNDDEELTLYSPADETIRGLKAFVVSDVHLNNHPENPDEDSNAPRPRNFWRFLTQMHRELTPEDRVLLVLNGDILDITGSWSDEPMPWNPERAKVVAALTLLLKDIMENNAAALEELRKLLRHPHLELIYVFGNHDGILQQYPEGQEVIRHFLAGDDIAMGERLRFVEHYICPELNLYAAHGHLLDPFNRRLLPGEPPLGDVINVLIVNRFVEVALRRLREQGYSEAFLIRMHSRLHDIECLRPLALVPVWIQTLAHQFRDHPESMGKVKPIDTVLIDAIAEILSNPATLRFLTERLHLPRRLLRLIILFAIRLPAILPLISFLTSKVAKPGHSNKAQYKAAQRLYRENGYRLVVFGHTHIPTVSPLSESAYYFNTGSWKPVINLFKASKDLVELEYLNPEVQFNKVERSGILRIHKLAGETLSPAEFSLQTVQSGLN
jgi:UDP-2,3-diacylglucosamine pyrophosphatase LpxH